MMKRTQICIIRFLTTVLIFGLASMTAASETDDTLFVYLSNGHIDAYPMQYVHSVDTSSPHSIVLTLINEEAVTYARSEYDSLSHTGPAMPRFTSFYFNKKFNEELTENVEGIIEGNNIYMDVAAIGKNLTPSFKTSDDKALVCVNGHTQISNKSRLRFANDVIYTVSLPGNRVFTRRTVSEEIWSDPQKEGWVDMPITPEMLSTNMPSNYPDTEDLFTLLDGNPTTYFQSTWGSGAYMQKSEYAYIDVALPYSLSEFRFSIQGRNISYYNATEIEVYTSANGKDWTLKKRITTADGLPTGYGGQIFTSDAIPCDKPINHVRLRVTNAEHSKTQGDGFVLYYISWAELKIQEYHENGEEPQLIQPAVYSYEMMPYGNEYTVQVYWLTNDLTSVPCIEIYTDNGLMPNHILRDQAADKLLWQTASFKLLGNGMYEDLEADILIKGRGNSSWAGTTGKSPYNIKFYEKMKPFGLTSGKNWVLLANRQTNSMLTNAIGMKAARLVDVTCANHIIPVDLYINGDYRGSYNFTEKVGISNNSVDIDEYTGVLIELDSYFDETYRYVTAPLGQPANIKDPDLTEEPFASEATTRFNEMKKDFNGFCKAIFDNNGYEYMMDVESFARFLMVNDLILNWEIAHPKSTFVFKEEVGNPTSMYFFGPIWDLDWAYGYENSGTYYLTSSKASIFEKTGSGWVGTNFFKPLLQNSDIVKKEYYRVWYNFTEGGGLDELLDYIQDYFDYAEPSLVKNASRWGDGANYASTLPNARKWLTERVNHIMSNIEVYDLDESFVFRYGDVNGDGQITATDVVCILNYILGSVDDDFEMSRGDLDSNGEITINDLVLVTHAVLDDGGHATPLRQGAATTQFLLSDFEAVLGEECSTAIGLIPLDDEDMSDEEEFSACEFSLILPEGMSFVRATATAGYTVSAQAIDDCRTRLLIYASDGRSLPFDEELVHLTLRADDVSDGSNRRLTLTQANIVTPDGNEQRMRTKSAAFSLTTGLDHTLATFRIVGGDVLTIDALEAVHIDIYTVDGRLAKAADIEAGTTHINLPSGIYIVNSRKLIIK